MADFDSAWKETLDTLFEPFMAFFFPEANREIDWTQPYDPLEQELLEITPASEQGRRMADKLIKVRRTSGREEWVLVHIEFQMAGGPPEPELPPADAHGNYPALETTRALMARKLIRSRQALGWSQVELARRAGVRPETINRIEQARRSRSLATFDKLYRALDEGEAEAARRKPAAGRRFVATIGVGGVAMREQIEVVYENGVLRPLEALPSHFQEHQRLTGGPMPDTKMGAIMMVIPYPSN